MKQCPTCKRTFDDSLTYCLDDGTPLAREDTRADSEETLVSPSPQYGTGSGGSNRELPPTQYAQLPGSATINAPQFQRPVSPVGYPQQRRIWPWVLAALALVFFLIIVIVIVIALPRIISATRNTNRELPRETPAATPAESPNETPVESVAETEAPTDEDEVLSQLTDIEKQWTAANVGGDKDALERILAAEYSGGDPPHSKREYINSLTPNEAVKSWGFDNLTLDLAGDRATINGHLKLDTTRGPELYEFTDTFVWRDGRWQAIGSRGSRVK